MNQWFPVDVILTPEYVDSKLQEFNGKLHKNTVWLKLKVLSSFLSFVKRKQPELPHLDELQDICGSVKRNESIHEFATEEQVQEILRITPEYRYELMVRLMYLQGLRVSELLNLWVSDVRSQGLVLRDTKGKRDAVIPWLSNGLREDLLAYIQRENITERLFTMGINSVEKTLKKYFVAAGYPLLTPHSLRRGCLVSLVERNVSLYIVQQIARHESLSTTEKYLKLTNKMIDSVNGIFDKQE
jgi:integrase